MRRGDLSTWAPSRILVDVRCLLEESPDDSAWNAVRSWFLSSRAASLLPRGVRSYFRPSLRWTYRSGAFAFMENVARLDASSDILLPHGFPHKAVAMLKPLWFVRLLPGEPRDGVVLVNREGYACFVTPDPHLITADRAVQLYDGPNHRFA